jgi:hypothetical protein
VAIPGPRGLTLGTLLFTLEIGKIPQGFGKIPLDAATSLEIGKMPLALGKIPLEIGKSLEFGKMPFSLGKIPLEIGTGSCLLTLLAFTLLFPRVEP